MGPDLLPLTLSGLGGLTLGVLVAVRAWNQRRADARRTVVTLRFPRGLRPDQVLAVIRVVTGLDAGSTGLSGPVGVAFEITGSRGQITHELRLPAAAASYLTAQLRAVVPGLVIETTEAAPFQPSAARELRRPVSVADLATSDPAAVSRTILAALTGLQQGEALRWQLVTVGGIVARPATQTWRHRLSGQAGVPVSARQAADGVVRTVIRLGAVAATPRRSRALVGRLIRAAGSVSAPGARLVGRWLPNWVAGTRMRRAATPLVSAPVLARPADLVALLGWPLGDPVVPGLVLGGAPQLPVPPDVPSRGRRLGRATVGGRRVALPLSGAAEHLGVFGPTGVGKSWLLARLFLGDVAAGRAAVLIDPQGGLSEAVLARLPEAAVSRTVVIDPTDTARPVPLPLLVPADGGDRELVADGLAALLKHRYGDIGPRSSDLVSSSLLALARLPEASFFDLWRLWHDTTFRDHVTALVGRDPVLGPFLAWLSELSPQERAVVVAPASNKLRPLVGRATVRNVVAAPRATVTMDEALRQRLVVIVRLPTGMLGTEATNLLGQVIVSQLWAASQRRSDRRLATVTLDEASRFVDIPGDLGEILARSRQYGVGWTLAAQALEQYPPRLREIVLNSCRSKVVFGTSSGDARRLADEFGPAVTPDMVRALGRYQALATVSLGATTSEPFTVATEALGKPIPGRAAAVRKASRERWGVPRADIEASFNEPLAGRSDSGGPVGRRKT